MKTLTIRGFNTSYITINRKTESLDVPTPKVSIHPILLLI